VVLGAAASMNHNLDSMDIAVIPCLGKTNLHKAATVFEALRLPVYVIWDSDRGNREKKVGDNHRLLRFFGAKVEDYPSAVEDQYACLEVDLDTTTRAEIREQLFDGLPSQAQQQYGYDSRDQARKNPSVIHWIFGEALLQGKESETLRAIVQQMVLLRSQVDG